MWPWDGLNGLTWGWWYSNECSAFGWPWWLWPATAFRRKRAAATARAATRASTAAATGAPSRSGSRSASTPSTSLATHNCCCDSCWTSTTTPTSTLLFSTLTWSSGSFSLGARWRKHTRGLCGYSGETAFLAAGNSTSDETKSGHQVEPWHWPLIAACPPQRVGKILFSARMPAQRPAAGENQVQISA